MSKPDTKNLALFFSRLHPLLSTATPVVSNFSPAINRPGPSNDLTDAFRVLPALAQVLSSSSPNGVTALKESVPITAFFGPYSPDLQGFVRDFGEGSAYYDANGHYARAAPVFNTFSLGANNTLTPGHPATGAGRLEDRPAAPLPGRRDAARGRWIIAVRRQRPGQL